MDFKDKIIMCLVAMVVLLAILNSAHKQEPEPANEIIYYVVDADGHLIGKIKAADLQK